jgi:RNA polymerase sigma factor (sigma-70 family)
MRDNRALAHVEYEGDLHVLEWSDDAPIIGFQVAPFNWRVRRAREAKGWSRAELARQAGISSTTTGHAEQLRHIGAVARWQIALALGVPEDVLFPGEIDALADCGETRRLEVPLYRDDVQALGGEVNSVVDVAEAGEQRVLSSVMRDALDTLTPRERRVMQLRYGVDGSAPMTYEEIGREFGVTRERIRQIESKALRKLRHPLRTRRFRDFLADGYPYHAPRSAPSPSECQRTRSRPNREPCARVHPLPGWLLALPCAEQRRPGVWCGVCWATYLRDTARARYG